MRLILVDVDPDVRTNFYPLALSRPIWELRCGMSSLGEKLIAKFGTADVAYFVPSYMARAYREQRDLPVNDISQLVDDDLLIVDPRLRADEIDLSAAGPSEVGLDEGGRVLYARIAREDLGKLPNDLDDIEKFLNAAKVSLPTVQDLPEGGKLPTWNYIWELVLANSGQIVADFALAGRSGVEGNVEQPGAIRGNKKDVYIAPSAVVHPMVTIDAENGPVYIDEDVVVHPFTRIEGPCYIGKGSILLGTKCREGCSIGPFCRVGGEVEESIIQGYSNKYHDGFIGHAYVGEWVNLGALTTNSDLKNDYSNVTVTLTGRRPIETGSNKVGALIGDHTKTSIGVLLNTGAYVGAMAVIVATGKPLPKFIPSFGWFLENAVTKGFGKSRLYQTARTVLARRKRQWSEAQEAMWDAVFEMTAPIRAEMIRRGRRKTSKK